MRTHTDAFAAANCLLVPLPRGTAYCDGDTILWATHESLPCGQEEITQNGTPTICTPFGSAYCTGLRRIQQTRRQTFVEIVKAKAENSTAYAESFGTSMESCLGKRRRCRGPFGIFWG